MRALSRLYMLAACLLASVVAVAAPAGDSDAARLHRLGNFEQAVVQWEQHASTVEGDAARLRLLLGKAESLRALGRQQQAGEALNEALALSEALQDDVLQAVALNGLANVTMATGDPDVAGTYLTRATALLNQSSHPDMLAAIQINLGNLHAAREQQAEAMEAYARGAEFARQAGKPLLRAQALGNAAHVAARNGDKARARSLASTAGSVVATLENSHDKAFLLLSLGQLEGRLAEDGNFSRAYRILTDALGTADASGDARLRSYALGYLAQLYEQQKRDADARELNRRAIAALQQVDAPEIAYRWYWHQGKLNGRQGNTVDAIADYRLAMHHLQRIRADIPVTGMAGKSSFREVLGPLYYELADLLLQRAFTVTGKDEKQELLREARNTVELSKAAELQDYFQDRCVAAQQKRLGQQAARFGADVAVIYPVLLPDRLEVLVDFADGMRQFTTRIPSRQIADTTKDFRAMLEKRTTREYLPLGQTLYDWLMRPLEAELAAHGIKTLVFVPDSFLRTIPMSALHDGKTFLVTHYAVATTPSLALTDTRPVSVAGPQRALLNGLTQAVQGFSALPNVEAELQAVGQHYRGKVLKDQEYLVDKLEAELDQTRYNVVHIASHGQFERDVRQTFLLAYDGKLTMDGLEKLISPHRYRDSPISLLTLSACQTAAGDDRAALGLAGVAVKAGASSALASLWFINDQSASLLVSGFYEQLRQPGMSKAHALQNAQIQMLTDKRFSHPSYWSPFLLIGNWL